MIKDVVILGTPKSARVACFQACGSDTIQESISAAPIRVSQGRTGSKQRSPPLVLEALAKCCHGIHVLLNFSCFLRLGLFLGRFSSGFYRFCFLCSLRLCFCPRLRSPRCCCFLGCHSCFFRFPSLPCPCILLPLLFLLSLCQRCRLAAGDRRKLLLHCLLSGLLRLDLFGFSCLLGRGPFAKDPPHLLALRSFFRFPFCGILGGLNGLGSLDSLLRRFSRSPRLLSTHLLSSFRRFSLSLCLLRTLLLSSFRGFGLSSGFFSLFCCSF